MQDATRAAKTACGTTLARVGSVAASVAQSPPKEAELMRVPTWTRITPGGDGFGRWEPLGSSSACSSQVARP